MPAPEEILYDFTVMVKGKVRALTGRHAETIVRNGIAFNLTIMDSVEDMSVTTSSPIDRLRGLEHGR